MIGLSLSFCVRDIALGKVKEQDVDGIIAGTCYKNNKEFEQVLSSYSRTYWINCPGATDIARRLNKAGKIDQPRTRGLEAPDLSGGIHWLDS